MNVYNLNCPEIEALEKLPPSKITLAAITKALSEASRIAGLSGYNEGAKLQVARQAMHVVGEALQKLVT